MKAEGKTIVSKQEARDSAKNTPQQPVVQINAEKKTSDTVVNQPLNVVGYARYSTQKQDQGLSIESQEKEIKELCTTRNWQYLRLYSDTHTSGAVPIKEREALSQLMRDAKKGNFDLVVVFDITRLARDQGIFWEAVTTLKAIGVKFTTVIMPDYDSSTAEFQLLAGALQGAGSYERLLVSRKVKIAMAIVKSHGRKVGRPPAGYDSTAIKGEYILSPHGEKTVELLKRNPKITAAILQKQLGLTNYKEAWNLLTSIKKNSGASHLGKQQAPSSAIN